MDPSTHMSYDQCYVDKSTLKHTSHTTCLLLKTYTFTHNLENRHGSFTAGPSAVRQNLKALIYTSLLYHRVRGTASRTLRCDSAKVATLAASTKQNSQGIPLPRCCTTMPAKLSAFTWRSSSCSGAPCQHLSWRSSGS
jgi:hypothetical protein